MAADVNRYLENQPLEAGPPSVGYRLTKLLSRNKLAIGVSTILTATVILGFLSTAWQAWVATRERDAKQVALTAKDEALATASQNLQIAMDAVDQIYLSVAKDQRLVNAGRWRLLPSEDPFSNPARPLGLKTEISPEERKMLASGMTIYESIAAQNPEAREAKFRTAKAFCSLGQIRAFLGEMKAAKEAYSNAIRLLTPAVDDDAGNDPDWLTLLAEANYRLGETSVFWPAAETAFSRAVFVANRGLEAKPEQAELLRIRARARIALSEYEEALDDLESVVALQPFVAENHSAIARLLNYRDADPDLNDGDADQEKAAAHARKAVELDPANPRHRIILCEYLDDEQQAGLWEEAVAHAEGPKQELRISLARGSSSKGHPSGHTNCQ